MTVPERTPARRRSVHFVPGGNERYLASALASAADTLVLDLEDSVPPERKPAARASVTEWLGSADVVERAAGKELMVRINALDTPWGRTDVESVVAAIVGLGARSLMVPKVERIADLDALDAVIAATDPNAAVTYFPVVTETAAGVVNLPEVAAHHRIDGVCWGAEDLSAALGATHRARSGQDSSSRCSRWCAAGA